MTTSDEIRELKRNIARLVYAEIEELSNVSSIPDRPPGIFVDGWFFPDHELQETNPTFGASDAETPE